VTSQANLLAAIADRLETAGIPYMVVGSVASSYHGEPRTTLDIDIVIDPSSEALHRFVASLPTSDYYVDNNAVLEAYDRRTSFNVIESATGWKVDLLIRRERPFSRIEFGRRVVGSILGRPTPVATAEDTIIAKLEWSKAGESERQLHDAARILSAGATSLDRAYIARWIGELDLGDAWARAEALADMAEH
jgi:hypothetical protein